MKKYFIEEVKKIKLSEYLSELDKQIQEIGEEIDKFSTGVYELSWHKYGLERKQKELSLLIKKNKYIYSCLGDVLIRKDMIESFLETFDSEEHRYGTICFKPETIKATYQISEMFPELSKQALIFIRKEYIKDLFDKYSLIETLAMMIHKDGKEDIVFEKFIQKVQELADKEDKIYHYEAEWITTFCREYPYDFVHHFKKFMREHHISWKKFSECLPSSELIRKDMETLKYLSSKAKDCWGSCDPVTFQMLEDYLDGDTELSFFEEQPYYYISTISGKTLTPFTKQEFLESIQKTKIKKLERK